jgi:hypothetical protein
MPLTNPPHNLQPTLLVLETTSTILPTPMQTAHPAISSTFSPATCSSKLGTNLNYPNHAHPTFSSTSSPETRTSSPGIILNYPNHNDDICYSSNLINLLSCNLLLQPRNQPQLSYIHPCKLLIQQSHPLPHLQPELLALEPTSTIIPIPMPLAHLLTNLQPVFLAKESTSTILSTYMPLAHPPPNVQPTLLSWNQPQLSYPHPCHLLIYLLSINLLF